MGRCLKLAQKVLPCRHILRLMNCNDLEEEDCCILVVILEISMSAPALAQRDGLDYLKWGCVRYLSIVSIFMTFSRRWQHISSLEKQKGVPAQKLLWMGSAARGILTTKKKVPPKIITLIVSVHYI